MPSANASHRSQEKRGRSWTRRKWVSSSPGLEEQTLGPDRARGVGWEGSRVSGGLTALDPWRHSARNRPRAWGPGAGAFNRASGPLPKHLSQTHPGSHFLLGRLEAWLSRSVSQSWRAGRGARRREVPTAPEVGAAGPTLNLAGLGTYFTYSVSFPEIFNVH